MRSIISIWRTEETSHAGVQVLCWKLTGKGSFYNLYNSIIFSWSHSKNITDSESCILTIAEEKKTGCSLLKFWLPPVRALTFPSLKFWPEEQHLTEQNLGQQHMFAYLKNCTTRPDLGEHTHFLSCIRPTIDRVEQTPFPLPHTRAEAQKCRTLILQLANALDKAKEPWPSRSSSFSSLQGAFTVI